MLQLIFLVFIENPHIEKTYGSFKNDTNEELIKSGYFEKRKDMIIFFNLDILRASDIMLLLLVIYSVILAIQQNSITFHVMYVYILSFLIFFPVMFCVGDCCIQLDWDIYFAVKVKAITLLLAMRKKEVPNSKRSRAGRSSTISR